MASAVRKLTGVGGDIRKIARLLQKEAPPGHMLAYINQEEADLLKARGGSGKPHADTGVPSFEEDPSTYLPDFKDNEMFDIRQSRQADTANAPAEIQQSSVQSQSTAPLDLISGQAAAPQAAAPKIDLGQDFAAPQSAEGKTSFIAAADANIASVGDRFKTPAELGFQPGGSEKPTAENKTTFAEDAKDWWKTLKPDTKARLGIGGIEAVIGAYQTSQAMEQARKYREDIAKTAQPYQQQGKDLIAKAQSGELSPAAQQTLQAAQAQAAQGAQARGGVGAQQAQAQVEGLRQQLLQQQYDYGLKVLGIGDSIAVGAIKAGMQADQYVNQLANNYTMNIARTVAGTPTYVDARQSGVAK